MATSVIIEPLERRQLLSAGAVAVGPESLVNSYTTGHQFAPFVAMDAAGDHVAVWYESGQDGSGDGVFGQRFNSAGIAQGRDRKSVV